MQTLANIIYPELTPAMEKKLYFKTNGFVWYDYDTREERLWHIQS